MKLIFPGSKTDALMRLQAGDSLIVPCGTRSVQSVMSSLTSLPPRRNVSSSEFTQRKALIVIDETVKPLPVVLVTRRSEPG